jgi:signal transduction histidine kinase
LTRPEETSHFAEAYLVGALLAVPILFRHRYPFQVLVVTAVAMLLYYTLDRGNISPAPVFFVPFYDAAVAGYLVWAIAISAAFIAGGLVLAELSTGKSLTVLSPDFLPQVVVLSQIVILALAVMLGEVVRGRRVLAAETARRLQLAVEERAAEEARALAEERLRIARELHDTAAHSMATITVQAGSALHLLGGGDKTPEPFVPNDPGLNSQVPGSERAADADTLRAALTAIRETSKSALAEMRSVLGQLRRPDPKDPETPGRPGRAVSAATATGLSRLPALRDAVTAAGARVTVTVEGEQPPLSGEADHSAYRILQESLTNVLRHAGPGAAAEVRLHYRPGVLTITVTDDGPGAADGRATPDGGGANGHGIRGMRERAASVGGELTAGPLSGGGFQAKATLPTAPRVATDAPGTDSAPGREPADVPGPSSDSTPGPSADSASAPGTDRASAREPADVPGPSSDTAPAREPADVPATRGKPS